MPLGKSPSKRPSASRSTMMDTRSKKSTTDIQVEVALTRTAALEKTVKDLEKKIDDNDQKTNAIIAKMMATMAESLKSQTKDLANALKCQVDALKVALISLDKKVDDISKSTQTGPADHKPQSQLHAKELITGTSYADKTRQRRPRAKGSAQPETTISSTPPPMTRENLTIVVRSGTPFTERYDGSKKASEIRKALTKAFPDDVKDVDFVNHVKNGHVIIRVLNTAVKKLITENTEWLQEVSDKDKVLRPRDKVHVILRQVPRDIQPSTIKEKTGAEKAEWLTKPPADEEHMPYETGIVKLTFATPEEAAKFAQNGAVSFNMRPCYVEEYKPRKRTSHCYRCWKHGHLQSQCPEEKAACGRCAKEHDTSECTVDKEDTMSFVCINCKRNNAPNCTGHAAWAVLCPNSTNV